jgi:hypothetical protein
MQNTCCEPRVLTDVVQGVLSLGVLGYVVKAHAGNELLAAVGAVLQGRQFVSRELSGHNSTNPTDTQVLDRFHHETPPSFAPRKAEITRSHEVQFYSDDASFLAGFACFYRSRSKRWKCGYRYRDRVTPEESY